MWKCMIRFSLVIQNKKKEYLICKCPLTEQDDFSYEFLGGEIIGNTIPNGVELELAVNKIAYEKLGVMVGELSEMEMYWKEDYVPWVHVIYSANIKSGNPQKKFYKKILWEKLDDIEMTSLNLYGIQVVRKLNECKYCHYIHDFKEDLDEFFGNFFSRQEEYIQTLEAIGTNNINDVVYNVIFKQVLSHFRASLIESETLKKNITVQNYLRLYDRDDVAKQLNDLLLIEIMPTLSLKSMIKESVDKYIAHYDKPTQKSDEIYTICKAFFAENGKFPLQEFMRYLDGFIMSLFTEMWYDAGELGIKISERCIVQREAIIEYRMVMLDAIIERI